MKTLLKLLIVLSLLGITACSNKPVNVKRWADNSEYALYTLTTADLLQTRQIRDREDLVEKESKWICGSNPEDDCMLGWFGARYFAIWWLNHQAPLSNMQRYRINMFLNTWTFRAVRSNLMLGLEIKL